METHYKKSESDIKHALQSAHCLKKEVKLTMLMSVQDALNGNFALLNLGTAVF